MKKTLLAVFCVLVTLTQVSAQDKITSDDVVNIRYAANSVLKLMPYLLTTIASTQVDDGIRQEDIINSYQTGNKHQIFQDARQSTIDDDRDPQSSLANTANLNVEDYLNYFDTGYAKVDEPSITFTNVVYSDVKRNEKFTYILLKFDSQFDAPYPVKNKVALIEVEKINGKWTALIGNIQFYDPSKPIENTDNNVTVYRDTSSTAEVVSDNQLKNQVDSVETVRNAEEKKNDDDFNKYLDAGNAAYADRHYSDAANYYDQALDMKPMDIALDNKLQETKREITHNTYAYLNNEGNQFMAERKFIEANDCYKKAQDQKPDANLTETVIKQITNILIVSNYANNLLLSKNYQGAIDECKKQLKAHKNDKGNFPELYYITAKAYEGLYMIKPEDPGYKDGEPRNDNLRDAQKNYDLANNVVNYIDALIARANFNVRYLNDYAKGISDYDLVINDATDDNPLKPGYYITKAKWEEDQHNTDNGDAAFSDYTNAIKLSRRTDSLFFERGKFLYHLKKYDDAKADFDAAIKLNPKYKLAYYYRGLNYAAANNNLLAGNDFARLVILGINPEQSQTIDSLSNNYFVIAETVYSNHVYSTADSNYNCALELLQSNSKALHGKANIYFSEATELVGHGKIDDARNSFLKSIASNKEAIRFNANFSDAFYKKGMAQNAIQQYDNAIRSYDEAIRSDSTNVDAFIERAGTYQTISNYSKAVESYNRAIILLLTNLEAVKKGNDKSMVENVQFKLSNTYQLDARSLYCLSDYTNAMFNVKKALDYDEQNAEAFYYEGLISEAQGDVSRAIKNYDDALKATSDYRYYYARAKANYKDKNYQESIDDYTNAIKNDTAVTVKNRNYLRGLCFFKTKNYDQALSDYVEYGKFANSKTDTAFYADYGYSELYKTRDTTANIHFKMALALNPNNPIALYGLGCSYANAGKFDNAIMYFEKSFKTGLLRKDDIKLYEDDFLDKLKDNKASKNKYNALKKSYLND